MRKHFHERPVYTQTRNQHHFFLKHDTFPTYLTQKRLLENNALPTRAILGMQQRITTIEHPLYTMGWENICRKK